MAEKKISQLTAKGATVADTDLLVISESAGGGAYTTKSVTGANVKALVTDANLTTTDITTNNVSTSKHGFVPKAPNDATKFLDGTGAWSTPAGGGGGLTVGTTAVTSGTVGRIFFQGTGDVVQQDSTLFWDNTNKRLGVGATPSTSVRLDVRAQGALSTDVALRVRNSANTIDFLVVNGAGDVFNRGAGGVSTNTFFGENSGRSATGGTNTFLGANAGESNTTAIQNTFIGEQAGNKTTTGNSNTFVGKSAGFSNTTGILNCIFGRETGYFNTTGGYNSFFGAEAGFSNTTASGNSFFGSEAGRSNTTGNSNSFFGRDSGRANTTGFDNSFFGLESGKANTTGAYNSFFGKGAGISNTTGQQNVFIGNNAGYFNSTGSYNTYVGRETNSYITAGTNNVSLGYYAGEKIASGSNLTDATNSVLLGANTRANANSETNQIVIGDSAVGIGSNTAVLGNTSIVTTQLRGNVISGNQAALATTATDGFLYIPTCAGTPTGTPTAITGKVPMVADTTNNKLYIYVGGAWTAMN